MSSTSRSNARVLQPSIIDHTLKEYMKLCCQFAAGFRFQHAKPDEPWDEVLFESANFVAMPTRGSLIEGWLLVVPREHHYCVGSFSPDLLSEFQSFRREVQHILESIYGPVIAFEHGAIGSGRPVGCGVDHAHLHLVPWSGSFADTVRRQAIQDFQWKEIDGFHPLSAAHHARKDYLFFEEANGAVRMVASDAIPSQFFRRVIAAAIGQPDHYDWKQFSGIHNVTATVRKLRACGAYDVAE